MPCFEARVFLFMSGFLFRNMGWRNISRADSPACPSKTPHYFVDETLYSLKSVGGIGDGMWARSFLGFSPSLSLFSLHPAVGEPNTSLEPTLGFSYPSPLTWSIILSLFYVSCWFLLRVFLQKGQHFEVEKYCLIFKWTSFCSVPICGWFLVHLFLFLICVWILVHFFLLLIFLVDFCCSFSRLIFGKLLVHSVPIC